VINAPPRIERRDAHAAVATSAHTPAAAAIAMYELYLNAR
jgi:hypothetical protein